VAAPFACGGLTQIGGGNEDAASDETAKPHVDAASDHAADAPDGVVADEQAFSGDAGTHADAFEPPPFDAHEFESCAPSPCNSDQICIVFAPTDSRNVCAGIPKACAPVPTCSCIEHAAPWCNVQACTADGGLVLSCETVPMP
jgi:hypothetical protein